MRYAIDREYRVQRALCGSGVPVPRMLACCADAGVIGQAFYVMAHVSGRNLDDPRLPDLEFAERTALMRNVAQTLARLHTLDAEALGLGDYGRPQGYVGRKLSRWTRQYRASETGTLPAMEALIGDLGRALSQDSGRAGLVHGDYRIDNLLFGHDASRCVAVLDWDLSTLGDPYADLAAVLMQWRLQPGAEGRGLAGVDRGSLGLPGDEDFLRDYEAVAGPVDRSALPAFIAFAFFRMAAVLQGVKMRGLSGNASNPDRAAGLGRMVPVYARLGVETLQSGMS